MQTINTSEADLHSHTSFGDGGLRTKWSKRGETQVLVASGTDGGGAKQHQPNGTVHLTPVAISQDHWVETAAPRSPFALLSPLI